MVDNETEGGVGLDGLGGFICGVKAGRRRKSLKTYENFGEWWNLEWQIYYIRE